MTQQASSSTDTVPKFKVGDIVKVINNVDGHSFLNAVGVVVDTRVDLSLPYLVEFPPGVGKYGHDGNGSKYTTKKVTNGWWFYGEELHPG